MARTRHTYPRDTLNLVPVMNLVTILIPFLLMSVQFAHIAAIDTTMPQICSDCESPEVGPNEPLNLAVAITPEGLRVTGTEVDELIPCRQGACVEPGDYDMSALTRQLGELKDQYPHEDSVVLSPTRTIPYQVLVMAMDATREQSARGSGQPRELFPFVVVAAQEGSGGL